MNRSVETIRYTLKHFDQKHPGSGDLSGPRRAADCRRPRRRSTAVSSRDVGRGIGSSAWPHADRIYRVINEMRAAADHGTAAGLHSARELCRPECGRRRSWGRCRAGTRKPRARRARQRAAALPGTPVRGAAADARAGSAPVPQVELPEVQGRRTPRAAGARPGRRAR